MLWLHAHLVWGRRFLAVGWLAVWAWWPCNVPCLALVRLIARADHTCSYRGRLSRFVQQLRGAGFTFYLSFHNFMSKYYFQGWSSQRGKTHMCVDLLTRLFSMNTHKKHDDCLCCNVCIPSKLDYSRTILFLTKLVFRKGQIWHYGLQILTYCESWDFCVAKLFRLFFIFQLKKPFSLGWLQLYQNLFLPKD